MTVRAGPVVVGGGVAGCTLLYELSKRSDKAVLLEAGRVGRQGASSTPLALLNPYRGKSAKATDFDLDALAATWRLAAELRREGLEPGLYRSGVYRFAATAKQGRNWRNRFERGDVAHGAEDVVRWLEPDAIPPGYRAPFGGFVAAAGGWVHPYTLLTSLLTSAQKRGATVTETCRVERIISRPNDSEARYRLVTTQGDVDADTVILCPGATPNPALPLPPLERVAGEVVGFRLDTPLPVPIAGSVYGGQRDGQLFVGGNHRALDESDPDVPT